MAKYEQLSPPRRHLPNKKAVQENWRCAS